MDPAGIIPSLTFFVEGVKATTIEGEVKGTSWYLIMEDVPGEEIRMDAVLFRFPKCHFYGFVGYIDPRSAETRLCKPKDIVTGAASNIKGFSGFDLKFLYRVYQVEIGTIDVPGQIATDVPFVESLFHRRGMS